MFYAGKPPRQNTSAEKDAWLDRFLAATVAFGHPGFLVFEGGTRSALRSYYMLQQLPAGTASPERWNPLRRRQWPPARHVRGGGFGAFTRSQVVTRYSDGTVTAANGHRTERMKVKAYDRDLDLPPNGYCGWTADGSIDVWSRDCGGGRADYAATPAYLYIDGRHRFVRAARAAGNGIGICRILPDGYEILLHEQCRVRLRDPGTTIGARALAKDGRELGPARLRKARGLTYVVPVEGTFSYILTASGDNRNRCCEGRSGRTAVRSPGSSPRRERDGSWQGSTPARHPGESQGRRAALVRVRGRLDRFHGARGTAEMDRLIIGRGQKDWLL